MTLIYDSNALTKWKVNAKLLPPDSVILNQPSSFYGKHKTLVWQVALVMAVLLTSILLLLMNIHKRRKAERALRESENRIRLSMNAAKAGSWNWNIETNEVVWDDRMQEIFGFEVGTYDGTYEAWKKSVHPEDVDEADRQTIEALKNGTDYDFEYRLNVKSEEGNWRRVRAQAIVVSNDKGERLRMAGFCEDITERKQAEEQIKSSLKEKEVLLQEIHHRVKNNMQVITSLLSLQSDTIKDEQYADMFRESQERIRSMALIHETLYQSEDFANIDFDGYLRTLINSLFISYGASPDKISLKIETNDLSLELDYAIPCGLIINELVSNSLKYAFPDERKGEIKIVLQEISENEMELTVSDEWYRHTGGT